MVANMRRLRPRAAQPGAKARETKSPVERKIIKLPLLEGRCNETRSIRVGTVEIKARWSPAASPCRYGREHKSSRCGGRMRPGYSVGHIDTTAPTTLSPGPRSPQYYQSSTNAGKLPGIPRLNPARVGRKGSAVAHGTPDPWEEAPIAIRNAAPRAQPWRKEGGDRPFSGSLPAGKVRTCNSQLGRMRVRKSDMHRGKRNPRVLAKTCPSARVSA